MACATNPSLSTVKGMVEFTDESLKGWRVGTEIFSGVQVGDLPFVLFGLDDDTTSSASSGSVVLSLSSGLLLSPELTLPASSGSLLLICGDVGFFSVFVVHLNVNIKNFLDTLLEEGCEL